VAARFLQLAGYEIYLPKVREGRAIKALFPSYLFAARAAQWYRARWSVGVVRFVTSGSGGEPTCVGVVDALRQRERDGLVVVSAGAGLKAWRCGADHSWYLHRRAGALRRDAAARVGVLLRVLGRVELPACDVVSV
jgi:hypothetical protein